MIGETTWIRPAWVCLTAPSNAALRRVLSLSRPHRENDNMRLGPQLSAAEPSFCFLCDMPTGPMAQDVARRLLWTPAPSASSSQVAYSRAGPQLIPVTLVTVFTTLIQDSVCL